MIRVAKNSVWILAAWAAVAAQAASPAFCRSCDRPCCQIPAFPDQTIDTASTVPVGEPSGSCPLCAATATRGDNCPVEQSQEPCHCQLDARQDQPLLPLRVSAPAFDLAAQAALPAAIVLECPRTHDVGREYLATALAIPIRPARILFGVWRD